MRQRVAVLTVSVALVIGPVVGPTVARADGHWRNARQIHLHHHPRPFPHRPFHGTVFVSPVVPRSCFTLVNRHHVAAFGCFAPSLIYVPTVVYVPPATYALPPAAAYPAYVMPPAPPSPPLARVIQYPTGRYELRGDGITTPYVWVWIPNPPPPPAAPPEPPPAAPSPEPPAAAPMGSVAPSPPREIYRWTDEQDVTNWTDRLDKVPERYRAQARRNG